MPFCETTSQSSSNCPWSCGSAKLGAPPSHQVPVSRHWYLSPVSKVLPSLEGQVVPGKYLRCPHSVPHCPHLAAPRFCGHQQQNGASLQPPSGPMVGAGVGTG